MIKHVDGALDRVCHECKKRGFDRMAWVYLRASDIGAHHHRRRWYFLAARSDDMDQKIPVVSTSKVEELRSLFCESKVPRLKARTGDALEERQARMRMSALGNSVVPAAVAVAWNVVARALNSGRTGEVPLDFESRHEPLDLVFDDGTRAEVWLTPVHQENHWYPQVKNEGRNRGMFATRVFHEKGTMREFHFRDIRRGRRAWQLNPEFVEALMGFPLGWTKVDYTGRRGSSSPPAVQTTGGSAFTDESNTDSQST